MGSALVSLESPHLAVYMPFIDNFHLSPNVYVSFQWGGGFAFDPGLGARQDRAEGSIMVSFKNLHISSYMLSFGTFRLFSPLCVEFEFVYGVFRFPGLAVVWYMALGASKTKSENYLALHIRGLQVYLVRRYRCSSTFYTGRLSAADSRPHASI